MSGGASANADTNIPSARKAEGAHVAPAGAGGHSIRLIHQLLKIPFPAVHRGAKFFDSSGFDLSDPLLRDHHFRPYLSQIHRFMTRLQTVSIVNYCTFTLIQCL